jgi:hypothetical protein
MLVQWTHVSLHEKNASALGHLIPSLREVNQV